MTEPQYTRYAAGEFTAGTAQALAGQRADITVTNKHYRSTEYENAIIVRPEGDTLILADHGEYGRYEQVTVPLADVRLAGNVRPLISRVTVLHGHDSPETAYLIEDYPYGRFDRCQMRVWIERAEKGAKKGRYRVMRQTNDPKRYGSGRYGEGPGGHPWNAPKGGTYSDWEVLYLDEKEHVRSHAGSFIGGTSGAGDAKLRLDGTVAQLDEAERKRYNLSVKVGQRQDKYMWEPWRMALEFIAGYQDEHGVLPGPREVQEAPGFHLQDYSYPVAVAAVMAGLEVPAAVVAA